MTPTAKFEKGDLVLLQKPFMWVNGIYWQLGIINKKYGKETYFVRYENLTTGNLLNYIEHVSNLTLISKSEFK